MKTPALLLACALVAGCATPPPATHPALLFGDALFAPPTTRINAAEVFAVSPEMKRFIGNEMAFDLRTKGAQRGLIEALYSRGQLKLEYDSALTRNAAEAFAARSGNCLSLVIMTGAFARELGLPVRFQRVLVDDAFGRKGDIYFSVGHVNLALGRKLTDAPTTRSTTEFITVDFLPPQDVRGARTRQIDESTIVAMYLNNRAVEALTLGNVDDAYWWAREAITQDPAHLAGYTTLGAVYLRHGNAREAERVLAHVLARDPGNLEAMANLVPALRAQGRGGEADALARRLAQLQPDPPFSYFDRGLAAMREGDYGTARDLLAREVARAPYLPEFHFWLAVANLRLGDLREARKHMADAVETSTNAHDHDLYAAKLALIKSGRM